MRRILFHPFLFALSPILFFFSYNKEELSLTNMNFLLSMSTILSVTLLLYFSAKLVIKNSEKSAAFVSLVVGLFFLYGHARSLISNFYFEVLDIGIGPDKVIFSLWGVIFAVGLYFLLKTKRSLAGLSTFLNVVSASAVLISLFQIIPYEIKTTGVGNLTEKNQSTEETIEISSAKLSELPDIYYLIFDRYGNESSLKEYRDFDNSEFINYLKNRGFYVASESFANYPRTFVSLASSLNLTYLDRLSVEVGEDFRSRIPIYEMIENNEVIAFLKARGYKYIHLGSWYEATSKNQNADITFNYYSSFQNNFLYTFLENTALNPILIKLDGDDPKRVQARKATIYEFDRLAEVSRIGGPKFVFAHFLIPHSPYVFDQDGNAITREQAEENTSAVNYINQLIFTNKKITEFVEKFTNGSKNRPIIIIQSDEGFFSSDWGKAIHRDLPQSTEVGLRGHSRIINAYYLPEFDAANLYPSITPVNTFRLVFNNYFGTSYPLLPDNCYIFQDSSHPYKFIDVTETVRFN